MKTRINKRDYIPAIPVMVSVVMLLLAIPPIWPYGYYILLRWIVCGSSAFLAFKAYSLEKRVWMWMMIFIAFVFNPIAPVYLQKETWVVIDLILTIFFFVSLFPLTKSGQ